MKYFKSTLKSVSIGLFFSLYCSVPVMAEDIEIYTSTGGNTITTKPNVLFIVDNSGSMNNHVHNVKQYFNVNNSYAAGANNATGCSFDESKIYYSTDGNQPACGSSEYFDLSQLNCDHASDEYNSSGVQISSNGPLERWGTYADQLSQRNASNVWGVIDRNDRPVECAQDQGIHGSNGAPTPNTYIVDSSAGWQSSATTPSVWSGGKNNYTLFHGKYLNYLMDTSVPDLASNPSRFDEIKRAMAALIDTNTSINVGLMTFDADFDSPYLVGRDRVDGGGVIFPVEDINTGRTAFKSAINGLVAITGTPLSETYHEALQYFGGKPVRYGLTSGPASVPASKDSSGNYISPIVNECQKNSIIVLTDGLPTHDNLTTAELALLPGFTDTTSCNSTDTYGESHCMDDMAAWALNNDVLQGTTGPGEGKQVIVTHTVGFANAALAAPNSLIRLTATAGGGKFVSASDADTLRGEISKVFADVLKVNTTFSSPAVSVNAFNRSIHLNDLYFTLFKPDGGSHWPGNLKKYKLEFFVDTNDVDNDGDTTERIPFIADFNHNNAVNPATGFFVAKDTPGLPNVLSYWSDALDYDVIENGGAAGEFNNNAPRRVYTFTGSYTNANGVFTPSVAALTSTVNKVDKTNTAITDVMLGIVGQSPSTQLPPTTPANTPRIETLLDWASGLDVFSKSGTPGTTTDQRLEMGDPLHSQPALVQYGGSTTNPDLVAYVATNDGYLHAIDASNGKELFAFIPQELLPNLNVLMEDSSADKTYGLDGDVVAWVNDANGDGTISGTGEHVYLYIGMRRGGKNIYSVDVTNRNAPRLRWVIKGGVGAYAELGQTWSSINVVKVKDGSGTGKTVLIFGGGYDTNQDNAATRTPDTKGRAVYIADATSGQLLWSAGPGGSLPLAGEMNYSIPARVTPLDISGDGNIDRLYAADMGGQIFRFDIDESTSSFSPASITGGRIADLAQDGSPADTRRFYYPPDVALIAQRGKQAYLALAITSGYRAHPNNIDTHDRIYLLKDKDIYSTPSTYATLTEADLYDATLNLAGGEGVSTSGNDALQVAAKTALSNAEGWYILLDDETSAGNWLGEKGLSEALILEGTVIVTTFTPTPPGATQLDNCTLQQAGTGKVFFMNVLDATPVITASTDKRPGRKLYGIAKSGIPPTPTVIITKGDATLCVGTECKAADLIKGVRKAYWYEVEK